MRRAAWLAGAALALSSTLALAAPESLLPEAFRTPAPPPSPTPTAAPVPVPAPAAPAPGVARPAPAPAPTASPMVQPPPGVAGAQVAPPLVVPPLPEGFAGRLPSLAELERMDEDELNELFGLTPDFDLPPGARRALRQVGVIGASEGGLPSGSLAEQPAELVRAALVATRGPLVSRWGHILLRRTLASRLDAPRGMNPVGFAALRANVLNQMGESAAARALVQDIDSANYSPGLAGVALQAYLSTGDILGMCPVAQLQGTLRDDAHWEMIRQICRAHTGDARDAEREITRALNRGQAPRIDLRLAQRYAGTAGEGRRSVTIEWDGVDELTPWRYGLARALGVPVPDALRDRAGWRYDAADVMIPAVPLPMRVAAADVAAERGILSSDATVGLYAQLWADGGVPAGEKQAAGFLREAYVARDPDARLGAMRRLWEDDAPYGRLVLTAYAAARLPAAEAMADDAPLILGSMLAAGLDRNAMRWAGVVPEGSLGWALLALADPQARVSVSSGAVSSFIGDDESASRRKSRFLVAGLAGLGRLDMGAAQSLAGDLGVNLARESAWSQRIDRAGELRNPALVALLAGLGMQGDSWERMTARHLFHIVRALDRAGLGAEARMIAAEAVARG